MFPKKFKSFNDTILKTLKDINKTYVKRIHINKNKLSFKEIFYFSLKLVTKSSYSTTNTDLKIDNFFNFSNNAYHKKRTLCDISYFDKIKDNILKDIYSNNTSRRFIAVDGSQLNLNKSLSKNDFKLSKNKNYTTGLLSSLFDTKKKIPIDYYLSNGKITETECLYKQLDKVNKNDVLIMDRGYYSEKLMETLHNKNINYIFRIKKSHVFFIKSKRFYYRNR